MKYRRWLIERVRTRAGLSSCRQAEAIIDDVLVLLARTLPAVTMDAVVHAVADTQSVYRPRIPAVSNGWSSSLDL